MKNINHTRSSISDDIRNKIGRAVQQECRDRKSGSAGMPRPISYAVFCWKKKRRIGAIAMKGTDRSPRRVRFVTWMLKYSRCNWRQVLGMDEDYDRSEHDER